MPKKPMTPAEMGKRRWKGITRAQRSEIARAAVRSRWDSRTAAELAGAAATRALLVNPTNK